MECNKEEAIRAKGIAEKKMEKNDFFGAKKIILKAQQLFPDLDNVSQMLTVCDVHCSAGTMVNGERDWYGILQVELTADESSIKKQYRKLALLLHPDKNKFAGAEAAFKLIGQAHMTLSDRGKRSLYDMKRITIVKTVSSRKPSQQPHMTSFVRKQPGVTKNTLNNTTSHYSDINLQHQSSISAAHAFWTICPSCGMRYQYHRAILNRSLRCQCCLKSFIACEINAQDVPSSSGVNSAHSGSHTEIPKQAVPGQPSFGNASSQGNFAGGPTAQEPCPRSGINNSHGSGSTSKEKDGVAGEEGGAGNEVKFEKATRKRGRKMDVEPSDSDSTEGSNDIEDLVMEEDGQPSVQNAGATNSHYPRRSTRQKQNVTYYEDVCEDDDDFVSPKKLRKDGSSRNTDRDKASFEEYADDKQKGGIPHEENLTNVKEQVNKYKMHESKQAGGGKGEESEAGVTSNADPPDHSPNLGSFSYPDPEFYDFEKNREASEFAVNQIWAVYDNLDGMPRFYARIREVFALKFKLRFTWLEHNAIGEAEKTWTKEELPISCGNYRLGKSEYTQDRLMFSHSMCWEKGSRSTYNIYPRKGEVWALFKGWDVGWSSDADNHRLYDYEVVEVLSDFAEGSDTSVIHLVKIKGFLSLFMRTKDKGTTLIPPAEVLRFSHKVPSYRMTGGEREGIPEGFFELDTASLPSNFEETFPSASLDGTKVSDEKLDGERSDSCFKSATDEEKFAAGAVNKKRAELNEDSWQTENKENSGLSPKGVNRVYDKEYSQVGEREGIDARNSNADVAAENHKSPPLTPPSPITCEYPPPEFHDFQKDKSIEKCRRGQIWALYSDVDKYPKYYVRIKKVDLEELKVDVAWLGLCPRREDEVIWSEKELPAGCGRFKVEHETMTFDTTDAFSHLVHAKQIGKRNLYDIYPSSGEVWAVYKNWSLGWTCSNLDNCEYDVVEVLEHTASVLKVLLLTKVDDHNAVFTHEVKAGFECTMMIPMDECMRFSHQIPAFRLTNEGDGKLRDCWELDPASVPDIFLLD